MMFSFFNKVNSYDKLAYEFNFNGIDGNQLILWIIKERLSL